MPTIVEVERKGASADDVEACPLNALAAAAAASSADSKQHTAPTPPPLRPESKDDDERIESTFRRNERAPVPHPYYLQQGMYYPPPLPPFNYWGYHPYALPYMTPPPGSTGFSRNKPSVVSPPVSSSLAPRTLSDAQDDASLPSSHKRRASMGKWSEHEDDVLKQAVNECGGKNWKRISMRLVGRTDVQCLHRWQKVLRPGLIKGAWTAEEDATVADLVSKFGTKKWSQIARSLNGRLGKQCRERWYNHLVSTNRRSVLTKMFLQN
jgi:hypothetical protein